MSDLDGERAFEMVLDRLETRHHEFEDERRKHDELRQKVWALEARIKELERENRELAIWKLNRQAKDAGVDPPPPPPEQPAKPSVAGDDIPF